jgi:dipeptidyl-peptidase-3
LFHSNSLTDLAALAEKKGVSAGEFKDLLQYAGAFYGNLGNYLSFGDTKFIVRFQMLL